MDVDWTPGSVEKPAIVAAAPADLWKPVRLSDPYAALYNRIQAGEKLVVYSGVRMPRGQVGAVEVQIPGEPAGIYFAYTRPDGRLMIEPLANPVPAVASPPRPFGWRSVDSMTPAEPIGAISAAPSPRSSPVPARSAARIGTTAPAGSPTVFRAITGSGTNWCST